MQILAKISFLLEGGCHRARKLDEFSGQILAGFVIIRHCLLPGEYFASFTRMSGRKYNAILVTAITLMIVHFAIVARDLKPFHSDFLVYYRAGEDFLSTKNLYDPSIFYRYKYSPSAAMLFVPFSLLPYQLASALFSLLLALAIGFCIHWATMSMRTTVAQ